MLKKPQYVIFFFLTPFGKKKHFSLKESSLEKKKEFFFIKKENAFFSEKKKQKAVFTTTSFSAFYSIYNELIEKQHSYFYRFIFESSFFVQNESVLSLSPSTIFRIKILHANGLLFFKLAEKKSKTLVGVFNKSFFYFNKMLLSSKNYPFT
jgi:hypothetical protein